MADSFLCPPGSRTGRIAIDGPRGSQDLDAMRLAAPEWATRSWRLSRDATPVRIPGEERIGHPGQGSPSLCRAGHPPRAILRPDPGDGGPDSGHAHGSSASPPQAHHAAEARRHDCPGTPGGPGTAGADWLNPDRGCDADRFREALEDRGTRACIPGRQSGGRAGRYDNRRYRRFDRIEIVSGRPEDRSRVAARYHRCAKVFLSTVARAATVIFRRQIPMSPEPGGPASGLDPARSCPRIGENLGYRADRLCAPISATRHLRDLRG